MPLLNTRKRGPFDPYVRELGYIFIEMTQGAMESVGRKGNGTPTHFLASNMYTSV